MKYATLFGIAAMTITATTTSLSAAEDIESPKFEVAISGEGAELRRYAPMIAAEVQVAADDVDAAGSMGFMPLANYIFGNNLPGETIDMTAPVTTAPVSERGSMTGGDGDKIAMTAPVTTSPTEDGLFTVRFMMPSKWTMDTLPAPADERVALVPVPERHIAVAGFTGAKEAASIKAAERAIEDFVSANNLVPTGEFTLAGYSAPFVPDPQKKWEVHLEVKAPQ